jgi:Ca2+-binding RTX toxin-like protein
LSGKSGRDGKLNFSVTASDASGASISDSFRISVTRNIADDIRPTTDVMQRLGSDIADFLQATKGFSDIISAGAGDDVIEFVEDETWQTIDNFTYSAWNVYSGDTIEINGKSRSFDAFDGGDGYDILNLSDQNDVMFLDDAIVSNVGEIAKISSIEEINAGAGDDVIDLTSLTFSYEDVILNGEAGDDVLWSGDGNDTLNGGEGDDNLQSGLGDDTINGNDGEDIIKAYDGDDSITGGSGADVITGGDGNDQFIFTNTTESSDSECDTILDFIQNEDKIDLSALGFDSITLGQNSNLSAAGLEYYFQDGNTIIDDPNSNFAIKLSGEISLGASDFNF